MQRGALQGRRHLRPSWRWPSSLSKGVGMKFRLVPVAFVFAGSCLLTDLAIDRTMSVAATQHRCPREQVRFEAEGGDWTYWINVCGRRRLYDTRDGRYQDITNSVE